MKVTLECIGFNARRSGTLVGIATIRIAELRLAFNDVYVHRKDGSAWAQAPSRPWVNTGEKTVITGEDGKIKYSPIFTFDNDDVRRAFSEAVVRAVKEKYPQTFD